jgi:hypothetical protein
MSDLRERFRVLDDVPVPDRIVSLLPPSVSPRRRTSSVRRIGTIVAALIVAAASFAILLRAVRPGPPDGYRPGVGPFSVRVGPAIPVGNAPNALAYGEGALWVSALPAEAPPYELVRVDPVTGAIAARIEVPALPTWEVGGGGLIALPDGVWVTGSVDRSEGAGCCGDAIVYRIDPATNEVAERVDLGPGSGADLWIDDRGVWILIFDDAPEPGISVVRLDRASLEEVARISLPTDWAKQVFAFDGSIWVHGNREGASEEEGVVPDVLFQIDPATNRYMGTVDLPTEEFSLAVDGTSVWQRASDGVIRVEPDGTRTRVPLDGMEAFCCTHIASDGTGGIWVVARADEPGRVQVVHVSAGARIDGRADAVVPDALLGSVAIAFDPEHRFLWLAQYEDTVTPLRLVAD